MGFIAPHVMRSIRLPLDRVNSLWAKELLTSSLALIAGGAYRVPQYYMARNTNPSIATEGWHPHQFFAMKPAELLREYADYRAVTLEQLAADARCRAAHQPEQIERVFDLVHLKYLAPMLSSEVLDYVIGESMRPDRTSRQIIEGMWKPAGSAFGGGRQRLRRHLARVLRLLRPASAAENVGYLQAPRQPLQPAQIAGEARCFVRSLAQRNDDQADGAGWPISPLHVVAAVPDVKTSPMEGR